MDLSISIVSWNTRDLLDDCLRSVYETTRGIDFEVIVIDNASTDGSPEMVREKYAQAMLITNSENVGFARANNQAYRASSGRCFMLLNPDTICRPGALAGLVRFLNDHPRAGAVGSLVLNPDESLQYSWARFPTIWSEIRGRLNRAIGPDGDHPRAAGSVRALGPFRADWIGGCCLMVTREAIEQIGLMDESLFMYSEETDWCLRLHSAGWERWVDPSVEIVHLGGQSSAQVSEKTRRILRASKATYFSKHQGRAAGVILAAALGAKSWAKSVWRIRGC